MPGRDEIVSNILGVVGAAVGGTLGYYVFTWCLSYSLYGMMIPGALLGLGCGLLSRHDSTARGVVCAVAAAVLSLVIEWKYFPFIADGSLSYLVTHVHQINPIHLLMMALGSAFAYWLGKDGGFHRIAPGRKAPPPRGA